jgi:hypothetical protein
MSRPGVEVTSASAAPPLGVPTDTSVHFIVGEAAQGPTDGPVRVGSLDEYTAKFGGRVPTVPVPYDAVETYLHDGGTTVYFQRATDGAATAEGAADALVAGATLSAASAGAWGNDVTVTLTGPVVSAQSTRGAKAKSAPARSPLLTYDVDAQAAGDLYDVEIDVAGSVVRKSVAPVATAGQLQAFLAQSDYAELAGVADPDAAIVGAGAVTLTGGDDGALPVTATSIEDALDLIPSDLGPGQLSAPGHSYDVHAALLAHAAANNRYALLDGDLGDDLATLMSGAAAVRGAEQDRYGMLWAPWATIPGVAPGTSRNVPWSAIQAALCARNDRAGNPNQAAAGQWGVSQYATGLTTTFSAADAETLLDAGVCTARRIYDSIQAYAFRSLSDPNGARRDWVQANWGRLNMAIVAQAERVGQSAVFAQVDGRGLTIAAFNGSLAAMLKEFYDDGALYAEPGTNDPSTAFVVNTGPQVNTPDKLIDGILSAVLSVRMSPHAELVQIAIVKYPITVSLA